EGRVFGHLDGPLDLIHGIDSTALVRIDNVQHRGSTAKVVARVDRRMHGVKLHSLGLEPAADLLDVLFLVIVEVAACRKDLDALSSAARKSVQHAGMQPLLDMNKAGDGSQHQ